ncbi:MAG: hypothetical protein JWP61_1795 [Friedmanniella sp.]|nr:hypothetical protein [Friedmanniella sp.]
MRPHPVPGRPGVMVMAVGLAWLAALLAVPPPRTHRLPDDPIAPASTGVAARARRPRPGLRLFGVLGAVVGFCLGGGLLAGARGVVLAGCLAVAGGTGVSWWRSRRRHQLVLRRRLEVARACAVLASHLRVGQVPTAALAAAVTDCPVLAEAAGIQAIGGDVVSLWRRQAGQPGLSGLLDLARSWQVAVESGAPLASVLGVVAENLQSDQVLQGVVAGELAAPRATAKVMAALPALGVAMGYLLGGSPLAWLWAGPMGWACLSAGVVLACAGVLWIELLAARATVGH